MPGPASRLTILMPFARAARVFSRVMCPLLAYSTTLRANSEMMVATWVASTELQPDSRLSRRPCWRAITMSAEALMAMVICASVAGDRCGMGFGEGVKVIISDPSCRPRIWRGPDRDRPIRLYVESEPHVAQGDDMAPHG